MREGGLLLECGAPLGRGPRSAGSREKQRRRSGHGAWRVAVPRPRRPIRVSSSPGLTAPRACGEGGTVVVRRATAHGPGRARSGAAPGGIDRLSRRGDHSCCQTGRPRTTEAARPDCPWAPTTAIKNCVVSITTEGVATELRPHYSHRAVGMLPRRVCYKSQFVRSLVI